ncbi:MAG: hypothetical protein F4X35_01370 [Alphaproteobacteria bacterium]|nr:hypothetical protein [Alphaproteobacteria bacterium]
MRPTTNNDKEKARDVLERVTLAVRALCIGKGDVRSRVKEAVLSHLVALREQDFPIDLQRKFTRIIQSSTRYDSSDLDRILPLPGGKSHNEFEDRFSATMRRSRRKTSAKIALEIFDLYIEIRRIANINYDD